MINEVKIIYKKYKTALNKLKYPDSWFWGRYTINPYSGCAHACIYCDARSNRYYLQQDFENEVIVKIDIDKILESKIQNARNLLPDVVAPGGVNDAYQPIEMQEKNTLKILRIFKDNKFPINLATKSSLITRDISLLNEIAKDTWCTIGFSITTTDEQLASFLEPFSSPPKVRLKAIKTIKEKGPQIQVGTYFMPIIPYLEDNEENLESVIKESKKHGADFILFAPGLTLRDSQAHFFINKLKESRYKEILTPLLSLFKDKTYPHSDYVKSIHTKLLSLCNKYKCLAGSKKALSETCPMASQEQVLGAAREKYQENDNSKMAKNAGIVEASGYNEWNRIRDTIEFCKLMGFKKIGIATCIGLMEETKQVAKILESHGFEVTAINCKVDSMKKDVVNIEKEFQMVSKTGYVILDISCNPIAQALLLNKAETDFNLIIGLCVGHDALFTKYSEAPVSTLIAKDRALNHNPASLLYTYYGDQLIRKF